MIDDLGVYSPVVKFGTLDGSSVIGGFSTKTVLLTVPNNYEKDYREELQQLMQSGESVTATFIFKVKLDGGTGVGTAEPTVAMTRIYTKTGTPPCRAGTTVIGCAITCTDGKVGKFRNCGGPIAKSYCGAIKSVEPFCK